MSCSDVYELLLDRQLRQLKKFEAAADDNDSAGFRSTSPSVEVEEDSRLSELVEGMHDVARLGRVNNDFAQISRMIGNQESLAQACVCVLAKDLVSKCRRAEYVGALLGYVGPEYERTKQKVKQLRERCKDLLLKLERYPASELELIPTCTMSYIATFVFRFQAPETTFIMDVSEGVGRNMVEPWRNGDPMTPDWIKSRLEPKHATRFLMTEEDWQNNLGGRAFNLLGGERRIHPCRGY